MTTQRELARLRRLIIATQDVEALDVYERLVMRASPEPLRSVTDAIATFNRYAMLPITGRTFVGELDGSFIDIAEMREIAFGMRLAHVFENGEQWIRSYPERHRSWSSAYWPAQLVRVYFEQHELASPNPKAGVESIHVINPSFRGRSGVESVLDWYFPWPRGRRGALRPEDVDEAFGVLYHAYNPRQLWLSPGDLPDIEAGDDVETGEVAGSRGLPIRSQTRFPDANELWAQTEAFGPWAPVAPLANVLSVIARHDIEELRRRAKEESRWQLADTIGGAAYAFLMRMIGGF